MYRQLQTTDEVVRKCCQTWGRKAGINVNLNEFKCHFINIYQITDVVKFRDFQFRLLHNRIFCNDVLVHWDKSTTNICNFCHLVKQDITHLLLSCEKAKNIWLDFSKFLFKRGIDYNINFKNVLFNTVNQNKHHIANFLTLIIKQFIFRCKCFDVIPNFHEAKAEIQKYHKIELFNAQSGGFTKKVVRKWRPVLPL